MPTLTIPPGLAEIAAGRDFIPTVDFARVFTISSQTARKNHCEQGACFGIRPVKAPGAGRLLWPVAAIAAVLNGEAAK